MQDKVPGIKVSLNNTIGQIVFDRPECKNAIAYDMWQAIPDIMQRLQQKGAGIIVFRGNNHCFTAGADLQELAVLSSKTSAQEALGVSPALPTVQAIETALNTISTFPLPCVALIDGPCLGGGCLLACACDLRFASASSTFSVPVARLGIVADEANIARLVSLIGVGRAKELLFLADTIDAKTAHAWGLINKIFADNDFLACAHQSLERLTLNSLQTIINAKATVAKLSKNIIANADNSKAVIASYLSDEFHQRVSKTIKLDT